MSPEHITGAGAVQFHFFNDQIIKTIEVGRLEIPLHAELNRLHILQKTQMLIFVDNISECCNFYKGLPKLARTFRGSYPSTEIKLSRKEVKFRSLFEDGLRAFIILNSNV